MNVSAVLIICRLKQKKKKLKTQEVKKKLSLNVGNIRNQFEKDAADENDSPVTKTPLPKVNKLNQNLFAQKSVEEEVPKKKEYVPIIIDRDAFERTKFAFEKEKKEEEERQNQLRYIFYIL